MRSVLPSLILIALALPAAAQVPCGMSGVTVTVSPSTAMVGQPILVTLTNNSGQLIQLPSSCTISTITKGNNCTGASVYLAFCLSVITPIPSGQSSNQMWDQLNQNLQQVPTGSYTVKVRYYDNAFNPLECCVPFEIRDDPGISYCATGNCPCGNPGANGEGCANSTSNGAQLSAIGNANVAQDTVVFSVVQAPPSVNGLFFSAPLASAPSLFGDGLLCVSGSIIRLAVVPTDAVGMATSNFTTSALEGLTGGELRHYQYWYRDLSGPCSTGFNTSNGYKIQW